MNGLGGSGKKNLSSKTHVVNIKAKQAIFLMRRGKIENRQRRRLRGFGELGHSIKLAGSKYSLVTRHCFPNNQTTLSVVFRPKVSITKGFGCLRSHFEA